MKDNTVFVRYEKDDFIGARKNLLGSTLNAIKLLKRYKGFLRLKTKEDSLKIELKRETKKAYDALKEFERTLPEAEKELGKKGVGAGERIVRKEREKRGKVRRTTAKSKLDRELEEIKAKLAALG